jgi:hypothetical protein
VLTALGVSMALVAAGPYVSQPPPGGCVVEDLLGRCLVSAVDPGRPGRAEPERPAEATDRRSPRPADGDDGTDGPPPPPPPPNYLVRPFGDGGWVRGGPELPDPAELLAAQPQAPDAPAVDPGVLAQEAIEALEIAPPELRLSVDGTGFVGVPVWLWLEGGEAATGPVSATATAGGARVTATARLSTVEWAMGPPGELVRCAGPGTPWTGQDGPSPDCGYVYTRRSLPERTAGRGVWTVTATAVWSVTWSGVSAGAPVEGTDTVSLASEAALPVGELQVLVGGGDR